MALSTWVTSGLLTPALGQAYTGVPVGPTVGLGDTRPALERLLNGGGTTQAPGWAVTLGASLEEQYTNSGGGGGTNGTGKSEFITAITPSIDIDGEDRRLKANLHYAPEAQFYVPSGNQNQIQQNFNGDALATLVPELLFLDLRGFAAVQASNGVRPPSGVTSLSRQDQTQSYSFSVAPYLVHRFGDIGTAELGYAFISSSNNPLSTNQTQPAANAGTVSSNLITQSEHFAFTSGDALGRISSSTLASAQQYDGSDVLQNAHNNLFTEDVGYAINRRIVLLGRIGYQDARYSTVPVYNLQDVVWGGGVRYTPGPDSEITIRYGHQDGFNSLGLTAGVSPTARTRLFASYKEVLTTDLTSLQDVVTSSVVDPYGNSIDRTTGAPIVPFDNFFGVQGGLYRNKTFSISGVYLLDRDTFSASIVSQRQELVGASSATPTSNEGSNRGTFGSVSWSHDVSDRTQTNVFLQYGVSQQPGIVTGTQQLFAMAISASYQLSEGLWTYGQYSYSNTQANTPGAGSAQNLAIIGLRKRF